MIMNLLNFVNGKSFEEVKETLSKEPYFLEIRETDDLYLFHYNRNKSDISNPIVKEAVGVILDKKTNKVVCYSNGIIQEYGVREVNEDNSKGVVENNDEGVEENNDEGVEENNDEEEEKDNAVAIEGPVSAEILLDGTVLRLFYYNDEWKVSTSKCIDAYKSYWTSEKSFAELFFETCVVDLDKLKPENCYYFALMHPDSVNVICHQEKKVIHIGTRNMETLLEVDEDLGIEKPSKLEFGSIEEVIESAKQLDKLTAGYIIRHNGDVFKILGEEYRKMKELRGNTPDFFYRCATVYKYGKRDEFLKYYPECKPIFDRIHHNLYELAKLIHQQYKLKYILKMDVPDTYDMILKHLHKKYLITKEKTYLYGVIQQIKGYSPLMFAKLVKD